MWRASSRGQRNTNKLCTVFALIYNDRSLYWYRIISGAIVQALNEKNHFSRAVNIYRAHFFFRFYGEPDPARPP